MTINVFVEEFSRESVECPTCGTSHEREWPDIISCRCGQEIAVDIEEECEHPYSSHPCPECGHEYCWECSSDSQHAGPGHNRDLLSWTTCPKCGHREEEISQYKPWKTRHAAEYLGVTRRRVAQLIAGGLILAEKDGRDWDIDEASVRAYAAIVSARRPKAEPKASQ